MAKSTSNYTDKQVARMKEVYKGETEEQSKATVQELADEFGFSTRSIVAKLSNMGIYVSYSGYKTKQGDKPIRKLDLVKKIATTAELNFNTIQSLESASKPALQAILDKVTPSEEIEQESNA